MSFHNHPHRARRQFLKKSFFLLSIAGAPSRPKPRRSEKNGAVPAAFNEAAPPARSPKIESKTGKYRVFDAHLHCPSEKGEVWQWHPVTRTFEESAGYLSRSEVERGIINSMRCQEAKSPGEFIAGNREVARYVEKYAGRFVGACVVNPLFIDEALREIENCRKQLGFRWVGELCNYTIPYQYTVKEFELLVDQVEKTNMVLDMHTELEEMEYIIRKFPKATIVFPHFGDSHEYEHIFRRIDLVARNPNCYLDTSGYGHDRVGMLEYAVSSIGPDRILFGSDFSINDPGCVIAQVQNSFLTEEQKGKILSENLTNLLKKLDV